MISSKFIYKKLVLKKLHKINMIINKFTTHKNTFPILPIRWARVGGSSYVSVELLYAYKGSHSNKYASKI